MLSSEGLGKRIERIQRFYARMQILKVKTRMNSSKEVNFAMKTTRNALQDRYFKYVPRRIDFQNE